jgi:hypothetical protein
MSNAQFAQRRALAASQTALGDARVFGSPMLAAMTASEGRVGEHGCGGLRPSYLVGLRFRC